MAYKDENKRRECWRKCAKRSYAKNKVAILARQEEYKREYLQTDQGKQVKINSFNRMKTLYPDKYKARYTLRNAVRLGRIQKGVCEICGSQDVESHHDDYSKPLEVRWFCHKHHCEIEGRLINKTGG